MPKPLNINCLHYHDGKCSHPVSRTFFGGCKTCILNSTDTRPSACRFKEERLKPPPPPAPPQDLDNYFLTALL